MLWLVTCTLSCTHEFRKKLCLSITPAADVLFNRVHTNSQTLAQNKHRPRELFCLGKHLSLCLHPTQLMHLKILLEWGYSRGKPVPDWDRKCRSQPREENSMPTSAALRSRSIRADPTGINLSTSPQWRSWWTTLQHWGVLLHYERQHTTLTQSPNEAGSEAQWAKATWKKVQQKEARMPFAPSSLTSSKELWKHHGCTLSFSLCPLLLFLNKIVMEQRQKNKNIIK